MVQPEQQRMVETRTLLMRCFVAEANFATFLMECMEKHATSLSLDETLKVKQLPSKITDLLKKIQVEQDTPPDKLPVYLQGAEKLTLSMAI
jgi:hypothetical protein